MLLFRVRARGKWSPAADADLAASGVQNLRTILIPGRRVGPAVHVGAETLCPHADPVIRA